MNKLYLKLMTPDGDGVGGGTGTPPPSGTPPPAGTTPPDSGTPPAAHWTDTIQDSETRKDVLRMFPGMKGVEDLAKTAAHQQRKLGVAGVPLPAKPEEFVPWMQTNFAVPKDGKGYKFDGVKMPEGVTLDTDAMSVFAENFAQAGLTQAQVDKVLGAYGGSIAEQQKAQKTARDTQAQESTQALTKEWGNDYKLNMARAETAIGILGGEGLVAKVQEAGLHNDVEFVKLLSNVGKLMEEDRTTGGMSKAGFAAGPKQAEFEIRQLESDSEFVKVYSTPSHPGYKEAREKMTRLFKIKHGEKV